MYVAGLTAQGPKWQDLFVRDLTVLLQHSHRQTDTQTDTQTHRQNTDHGIRPCRSQDTSAAAVERTEA